MSTLKTHSSIKTSLHCPDSGSESGQVWIEAVRNMLTHTEISLPDDQIFYYCSDAECPTVYFTETDEFKFTTSDLKAKVYDKDPGKDVNICYCFSINRKQILDEIDTNGDSGKAQFIADRINTEGCKCEILNPSGRCCLGEVQSFIKEHNH